MRVLNVRESFHGFTLSTPWRIAHTLRLAILSI